MSVLTKSAGRVGCVALGAALALGVSAVWRTSALPEAAAQPQPNAALPLVKTQRLEIADAEGNTRLVLTTAPKNGTGVLAVLDRAGKVRVAVGTTNAGSPSISLLNEDGKVVATVGTADNGAVAVNLADPAGTVRASVAVPANGEAGIEFYDAKGKSLRK
jgi:hypothetical protein